MAKFSPRIIEHFSNPRNAGTMDDADLTAFVGNPVCGDQIHLFVRLDGDRVARCTFLAYGCAASLATASILAEEAVGRRIEELATIDAARVNAMVGGLSPSQRHCAHLGEDVLGTLVRNYREGVVGVSTVSPALENAS